MFLAERIGKTATFALAATAIAMASPAFADIIVKSSGPSAKQFPVGKKLKATDRVTLKAGDRVTVLGSSGTRVLSGAGTYRVGARGAPTRTRYDQLTRQRSAARVRTGAARNAGGTVRSPNLWYVDVTKSASMCVADLANVTLWRPVVEGEQTYILKAAGSDYHHHVTFGDGVTTRSVDAERMPIKEGVEYRLSGPDGAEATTITFKLIEAAADNSEEMADALIANGCTQQLDLMAETLMTASN